MELFKTILSILLGYLLVNCVFQSCNNYQILDRTALRN